jgi:hypothetical protein
MTYIATGIAVLVTLFSIGSVQEGTHKYSGTKSCIPCHSGAKKGDMANIWKNSQHAKAFETLSSPAALEVGKAKGIANPAESPECLPCHTLGKTVDASLLDAKYAKEDGVQCESCHGPGADYKNAQVMKDHAKCVENGMTEFKDEAAIEAQCRTCHNEKSPTFKEFKFAEMWAKVKHPKP